MPVAYVKPTLSDTQHPVRKEEKLVRWPHLAQNLVRKILIFASGEVVMGGTERHLKDCAVAAVDAPHHHVKIAFHHVHSCLSHALVVHAELLDRFIKDTAVQKLMAVCDKALAFRKEQEDALGHSGGCSHARAKKLGDVTTLNLTMLKAGVAMAGGGGDDDVADGGKGGDQKEGQQRAAQEDKQRYALNVIPTEARAGFDVRIDPNTPTEDFKARLADWCKEEGVTWELADWTSPLHEHYLTSVDREENPWWGVFLVSFSRFWWGEARAGVLPTRTMYPSEYHSTPLCFSSLHACPDKVSSRVVLATNSSSPRVHAHAPTRPGHHEGLGGRDRAGDLPGEHGQPVPERAGHPGPGVLPDAKYAHPSARPQRVHRAGRFRGGHQGVRAPRRGFGVRRTAADGEIVV